MQTVSKIILGIDPGTVVMGYGLISVEGKSCTIIDMGVLKLSARKDAYQKLELIHSTVRELIKKHSPDFFAIESPFFGKNVQSMLKLGRAQGVAIATAMNAGLPVSEYSPKKIKQSITGNGNADKEQIWKMLQRIVEMPDKPKYFDATDAVAVALCHFYASQSPLADSAKKKSNSWEAFVKANGSRIRSQESGARRQE
ncbi:MAG TPA: crossover junction endodeoxyribonuclease RuvC [Chitinophagaceae bacterium]|nr:crossover junction endodeoxyribonuclease RuvC [Chitinophagaceae bacterium]